VKRPPQKVEIVFRGSVSVLVVCSFLASGCAWNVQQRVNQTVSEITDHPYDTAPQSADTNPREEKEDKKTAPPTDVSTDLQATAWMESDSAPERRVGRRKEDQVLTAIGSQADEQPAPVRKIDVTIPKALPGSEAPRVVLPEDKKSLEAEIDRIYPELPALPQEPEVQPGPEGKPYNLSDLQRMAAANSPTLRQAVANVEAAQGALVQAQTYPNPTVGYLFDPANNNSTANTQGVFIDQPIRTGGKQKLGSAAAQKDLDNAELALRRARSDLATAVRTAYFTLLVDVETLVVTRSLAQFTDEIYRLQAGLLKGAIAAPYEPASLRAQAFQTRLAYKQAIADYVYDWQKLVATMGIRHLPLTDIAGRVDRLIPYYDYDQVLAYTLQYHTDVLMGRNTIEKARYNLKLAQVTPLFPDLDVRASLERDKALFPFGTYSALMVGVPLSIWDQNKGNIINAQASLAFASEEPHRVEVALTNGLAAAYANYQDNLYAIEYYRRHILPDLVRYYRGIYERRQLERDSPFGDLVNAQQMLSSNVTSYLGVLQNLWMAVVGVADYLQTDDLFQFARPHELPELPDLGQLPPWPCGHEGLANCIESRGQMTVGPTRQDQGAE
jgi:cobalt-zinc-cadmium efflux system outer membrane protein